MPAATSTSDASNASAEPLPCSSTTAPTPKSSQSNTHSSTNSNEENVTKESSPNKSDNSKKNKNETQKKLKKNDDIKKEWMLYVGDSISHNVKFRTLEKETDSLIKTSKGYSAHFSYTSWIS